MLDYSKCMNRMIFCINLCSFFASCACVMRGLDPLKVKLAVVGDINRKGLIVLAATPELKKWVFLQQQDYMKYPKIRT